MIPRQHILDALAAFVERSVPRKGYASAGVRLGNALEAALATLEEPPVGIGILVRHIVISGKEGTPAKLADFSRWPEAQRQMRADRYRVVPNWFTRLKRMFHRPKATLVGRHVPPIFETPRWIATVVAESKLEATKTRLIRKGFLFTVRYIGDRRYRVARGPKQR